MSAVLFLNRYNSEEIAMRQITILGVNSSVGKRLLQKSIDSGFLVKALSSKPVSLYGMSDSVDMIIGDYFDKEILKYALEGSEVIFSTIGPSVNNLLSIEDEEKYIESLSYIIEKMHVNEQTRWISISGAGIKRTNEKLSSDRKLIRVRQKEESNSFVRIKDKELQLLEHSDLSWTSIRPALIEFGVEGLFIADETKLKSMTVDMDQLTDFMLAEIEDNKWIKKSPLVSTL